VETVPAVRILVIEDDLESRDHLVRALAEEGHATDAADDGETGLQKASAGAYDVMVVDRMLPKLDGLAVVRALRAAGVQTPALFLTALGSAEDRVAGLTGGGDDYLVKPFHYEELAARLALLGRRSEAPAQQANILRHRGLMLDRLRRTAERDGVRIPLKPLEFRLLETFMLHPDRVFTRMMLLEQIWGFRFDPQTNIVETHISHLRRKIDLPDGPSNIATVRHAGYCLRGD
jgi:two-component system OmpR family response regulator